MSDSGDRLATARISYGLGTLDEDSVASTWLEQFERWLDDAFASDMPEPGAMIVATAGGDGAPGARTVLLRGVDERGLRFLTNYDSRKGRELAQNPRATLVFPWYALQRQVTIEGDVERVPPEDSDAYFATRPRGAQISAVASPQSAVVESREWLHARWADTEREHDGRDVPRPDGWGGFRVVPHTVELWQGRRDRLHDRLRYRRTGAGAWVVERLAP